MSDSSIRYPDTPIRSVDEEIQGVLIQDPYRWLEDGQEEEVQAWDRAQNELARSYLNGLPLRSELEQRLDGLMRYDHPGMPFPVRSGTREFWYEKKKDQEHTVYCTRSDPSAETVALLDPNGWGETSSLAYTAPSPDGRYVAFGRDDAGREDWSLQVIETATGRVLPDRVWGWKQHGPTWLADGSGFFYSAKPKPGEVPEGEEHYWHAVWFHRLGSPAEEDIQIFHHDSIKEYWHAGRVSECGRWLLLDRSRMDRNELYLKDLEGEGDPIPVVTGFDGNYSVEVLDGRLVIQTDWEAPLGRVFVADPENPARENWRLLVDQSEDTLEAIGGIAGHLFLCYSHKVHTRMAVLDLDGNHVQDVPLPGLGSAGVRGFWARPEIGIYYSSFVHPPTAYRYHLEENRLEERARPPVDFDPELYITEQHWFESRDGTRVPMFVIHRKDLTRDGRRPVYMTAYGGFRHSMSPYFTLSYVPWLERGGVVAIPNLRGGGEFGATWHEAAIRENKQRSYDDFLAASEWLIQAGYTSPEQLVISGGSNGGLLVGAAMTQRPELFRAVKCDVPLLDMIRYHLFGFANVWTSDYGSIEEPGMLPVIHAYSPYHRVQPKVEYPAVLLTAGINDARVDPLHARKMAARLQAASRGRGPILLLLHDAAGHEGGTRLSHHVENWANEWAFLMDQVGMA